MKTENLKVSIIMPAFNAAKTIAESMESVLRQTFTEWELIVIDDGSTDETAEIVERFRRSEDRIFLLKLSKNGGLPNARNEGCKISSGEFIAFLDSDDVWLEDKLSVQVDFHARNPDIEISHTDFHPFNRNGVSKRPFKSLIDLKKNKQGDIYPQICYKNPIGVLTVMAKRGLLQEVNFFDASLWTMEDQDLWIRIAKRGKKFGYIEDVLAYYRTSEGSITSKTGKYKKAYKKFINKVLMSENVDTSLMWRYYYRHFGTVYFKKSQYGLSRLYFLKSIKLVPFDYIALSTYVYLFFVMLKGSFKNQIVN